MHRRLIGGDTPAHEEWQTEWHAMDRVRSEAWRKRDAYAAGAYAAAAVAAAAKRTAYKRQSAALLSLLAEAW